MAGERASHPAQMAYLSDATCHSVAGWHLYGLYRCRWHHAAGQRCPDFDRFADGTLWPAVGLSQMDRPDSGNQPGTQPVLAHSDGAEHGCHLAGGQDYDR